MELTSRLCRAQEAAQRERAASTSLENVRIVAERAATAWRQAAIEAEHREARRARTRAIAEIASLQKQRPNDDEQLFSENPDRGLAADLRPNEPNTLSEQDIGRKAPCPTASTAIASH